MYIDRYIQHTWILWVEERHHFRIFTNCRLFPKIFANGRNFRPTVSQLTKWDTKKTTLLSEKVGTWHHYTEGWKMRPHPRKLTWRPKIMIWKRWLLLNMTIFGIYLEHPMTSIFEGRPLKASPFPRKTRVIWVLGMLNFWGANRWVLFPGMCFYLRCQRPKIHMKIAPKNSPWKSMDFTTSKGKCWVPLGGYLSSCSPIITPCCPIEPLYNPYIGGICWYICRVLSQGYPTFPFDTCKVYTCIYIYTQFFGGLPFLLNSTCLRLNLTSIAIVSV